MFVGEFLLSNCCREVKENLLLRSLRVLVVNEMNFSVGNTLKLKALSCFQLFDPLGMIKMIKKT